jgi:RNA-directed DNA polymerase
MMKSETGADKRVEKLKRKVEGSDGITRVEPVAHQTDSAKVEHFEADTRELLNKILSKANMQEAYRRVVKNGGAPGVDGITVPELKAYCQQHWPRIREELLRGKYRPQAVRQVEIPKPNGGTRLLGIPTVMDRLIQQAIHQVLQPLFDPTFSPQSYGFRPNRSAQMAVADALTIVRSGYRWVVDMDLEKFFDRVNHDVLMHRLWKRIQDKSLLKLIRAYLKADLMLGGIESPRAEGVPQGGPLSPLLSNLLLDELDKELEQRGHRHVRYADDCNIYVKSKASGERVLKSITRYVEQRLKLRINSEKSAVARPWERKFLGYTMTWQQEPKLKVAASSVKRLKAKLKEVFRRGRGCAVATTIKQLEPLIRGWINYFKLSGVKGLFEELDGWLRRKIRVLYWRRWKKPTTRERKLKQLGLDAERAWKSANNGRGSWWNAGASHMNQAIPVKQLRRLGLLSFMEEYQRIKVY